MHAVLDVATIVDAGLEAVDVDCAVVREARERRAVAAVRSERNMLRM